jgi:hypothetical protein
MYSNSNCNSLRSLPLSACTLQLLHTLLKDPKTQKRCSPHGPPRVLAANGRRGAWAAWLACPSRPWAKIESRSTPWPCCFPLQPLPPLPALEGPGEPSRNALMPSAAWWCFSSMGLSQEKASGPAVGSRVQRMPVCAACQKRGGRGADQPSWRNRRVTSSVCNSKPENLSRQDLEQVSNTTRQS